jgi:hypothetical protein
MGMSVQSCNPDDTCRDLTVLNDYLDRFLQCGGPASPADSVGMQGPQSEKMAAILSAPASTSSGGEPGSTPRPATMVQVPEPALNTKSRT